MYVSCSLTSKENLTTIHKQNITLDLEVYIISKYFYLMSIMNWTTLQLQRTEKIPSWHSKLINRVKQQKKKPRKYTKIQTIHWESIPVLWQKLIRKIKTNIFTTEVPWKYFSQSCMTECFSILYEESSSDFDKVRLPQPSWSLPFDQLERRNNFKRLHYNIII